MQRLLLIILLTAAFLFLPSLVIKVSATHIQIHIRTDTISELGPTTNDVFCLDGNFESIYQINYYVKFPQRSSSSFKIIANGFTDNPYCNTGGTFVETQNPVPSDLTAGDTVELYSADPNADTTPPVQSNIQATNITQTGATISWTTDESATHTIKYDTTSGSYDSYANTKAAGTGTTSASASL